MWRPKLGIPLAAIVLGVLWMTSGTSGQTTSLPSTKNGEWPHYTADLRGTEYSPLDQINASNFKNLEVVWRFKTDSLGTRPEYKLEGTPLMIGGVLYTTGGTRRSVVALDARTGELLWKTSLGSAQIMMGPVTYEVDGKQYVSVICGNVMATFGLRE